MRGVHGHETLGTEICFQIEQPNRSFSASDSSSNFQRYSVKRHKIQTIA